jgi:hypothetical protein
MGIAGCTLPLQEFAYLPGDGDHLDNKISDVNLGYVYGSRHESTCTYGSTEEAGRSEATFLWL